MDVVGVEVLLFSHFFGWSLTAQQLYAGKITKCHPVVEFPDGWDVWHSPNHWSAEETIVRYIEEVIVPYSQRMKETLG